MRRWVVISVGWLSLLAPVACGPNISEVTMVTYPPREEGCSLEFLKIDMAALSSPSSEWEMIGQIVLNEEGEQDPLAERYRALVRTRACRMGGEAIGVAMNAHNESILVSGTAISYGVLRKRRSEPEQPSKF
ncbi:MAG: hypothetical protein JW940_35320 [Polyangiaceae bacterium]|nr:hypothetical protein [Polyangiaceae bacterium]